MPGIRSGRQAATGLDKGIEKGVLISAENK
jgi:hypothetical protein